MRLNRLVHARLALLTGGRSDRREDPPVRVHYTLRAEPKLKPIPLLLRFGVVRSFLPGSAVADERRPTEPGVPSIDLPRQLDRWCAQAHRTTTPIPPALDLTTTLAEWRATRGLGTLGEASLQRPVRWPSGRSEPPADTTDSRSRRGDLMHRMWIAGTVVFMSLVLGGGAVAAAAKTPLDSNISVNSGAEARQGGRGGVVPIPLWKTTSRMTAVKYGTAGFPSKAVAKDSFGEKNFFYCGRRTARSTAVQRIGINRRNRIINRGGLSMNLTVRIGSDTEDGDTGRMIVRYLNGKGRTIGKLRTETVGATGGLMIKVKTSGAVPEGTRALKVILKGTGTAGTSCDVFFDNVSVKLVKSL
jgi:hypothetical protein